MPKFRKIQSDVNKVVPDRPKDEVPETMGAARDAAAPGLREPEITWETSRIEMVERSERKAWNVVKLVSGLAVLLCLAIAMMMPLKTVEPFVIQTEKSTGMSTVLHIANEDDVPVDEMMNKYWISQYVLARESYDWQTLGQEYFKVRELSMPNVFEVYASQYGTENKDSLESRLKDDYRVVVKLVSVVINSDSVATVRFGKYTYENDHGEQTGHNSWTATIAFEYHPDFAVPEERRLVNPFGFKVTSYRVDPEID